MPKHTFQSFVEIFVVSGTFQYVAEKFTGQDEEPFFLYQSVPSFFCFIVRHLCVVKVRVSGFDLTVVDVTAKILWDVSVKHGAQHVVFEVPTVYSSTQLICNRPDGTVQFVTFLFFFGVNHVFPPVFPLLCILFRKKTHFWFDYTTKLPKRQCFSSDFSVVCTKEISYQKLQFPIFQVVFDKRGWKKTHFNFCPKGYFSHRTRKKMGSKNPRKHET